MGRAAFQVLVLPFRLTEGGAAEFAILRRADDGHVPVTCFKAAQEWPADTYLVPQYFFACNMTGLRVTLSGEHTRIGWLSYDEAHERLRYDSNKTALWELSERLRMKDLPPA